MSVDLNLQSAAIMKLLKFRKKPVTIQQYLEDDYYLGKFFAKDTQLFPMLREDIYNFFPNEIINRTNILCLTGSTGWGKTTASSIIENYIAQKFDCLEDPYMSLAHNRFNTVYKMKHVHVNKDKAYQKQVEPQLKLYHESPYWQDRYKLTGNLAPFGLDLEATTKLTHALSDETIVAHITEVNFYKPEFIEEMVSGMISRINNRFQLASIVFPLIILDSSNTYNNSYLDDFIQNSAYKDSIYVIHHNNWEVRRFLGIFDGLPEFEVYSGTGDTEPCVITENTDTSKFDEDRIIKNIPKTNEYYLAAISNIERFLQDYAGVSVITGSRFIKDVSLIDKCLTLESIYNKEIIIDELNDEQVTDIISLDDILRLLPPEGGYHISLDCGLKNDNTGLAIGYADSYKEIKIAENTYEPQIHIKVPIVLRFSRKDGQETSLDKISFFIASIIANRTVLSFTTDSYQSDHIRQQVRRYGVKDSTLLSKDRDDKAYQSLKLKMRRNEIEIANHPILKLELKELQYSDGKVDHLYTNSRIPNTNGIDGSISGLGCLIGETLIKTNNGYKKIMDLNSNDLIYAYDELNKIVIETEYKNLRVTKFVDEIYEIETENNKIIKCTNNHPILTKRGYVRAEELKKTDEILDVFVGEMNYVKIKSIKIQKLKNKIPVYDIEVPKYHNFVLANGLVVHNSKDIADAVAGVTYKIVRYGKDNFGNFDIQREINDYNKLLDDLTLYNRTKTNFNYNQIRRI